MTSDSELRRQVIALIVEVLAVEPDEINTEQNFFHDLGGESIDMIDLNFRVEKSLGVRAAFQQLTSSGRWDLDDDGKLTAASRVQLGEEYPFLKPGLESGRYESPYDLCTIGNLVAFVEQAAVAPKTQATSASTPSATGSE